MRLNEGMERNGDFLFRWRGYLPLLILAPLLYVLTTPEYFEQAFGETIEEVFEIISVSLVVFGILIRVITVGFVPKGTSGRNSTQQVAEVLNTTGLYSLTRNPLYVGNCLIYLGVLLFAQNPLLCLFGLFAMTFYYERIILREERFLSKKFGVQYSEWVKDVPAFVPRLTGWARPAMSFSWRSVLAREYPGVFYATLALCLIETIRSGLSEGEWIELEWLIPLGIAALFAGAVRYLKKKTTLLQQNGR